MPLPPVLFYTDHYTLPLPSGHRFPMPKYRMIRERLQATGRFELRPAPFADVEVIKRTHDPEYVDAVINGTLSAAVQRRIGFPWSEGFVRRTLGSAGSTLAATEEALLSGWSGTLSGGTHHAFRDEGSGFCVFNDIAIAANELLNGHVGAHVGAGYIPPEDDLHVGASPASTASGFVGASPASPVRLVQRIAIIDLDVHQGDGTAQIFNGSQQVFTLSVHCKVNFPFKKQMSRVDIELDEGLGDDEYLATLERVLPQVVEFKPDFVFYQGGVDVLATDTLGKLKLSLDGVRQRDRMVFEFVKTLGVPIVLTQGGGYSKPIEATAEAHANTFLIAADVFGH
jgi:acetoin utilization deacetylase AcuC-like enzyme